jgi:hypothetical protein
MDIIKLFFLIIYNYIIYHIINIYLCKYLLVTLFKKHLLNLNIILFIICNFPLYFIFVFYNIIHIINSYKINFNFC